MTNTPKTKTKRSRAKSAGPTPESIKRQKEKARELRQSGWWKQKLDDGVCHYCAQTFPKKELTMDHLVPLSRGGKSTKGNVVVACKECNSEKKYYTPAELILKNQLKQDVRF